MASQIPTYDILLEMSHGDLLTLQANVGRAIAETESKNRKAAVDELKARAKELGFDLNDLVKSSGASASGKPKNPQPAKYHNLANELETWSGRGRKPKWYTAYVEAHGEEKAEKDLAI